MKWGNLFANDNDQNRKERFPNLSFLVGMGYIKFLKLRILEI